MEIQLIDHVKGGKEITREKTSGFKSWRPWRPKVLNHNDGFYNQNKKSCAVARWR